MARKKRKQWEQSASQVRSAVDKVANGPGVPVDLRDKLVTMSNDLIKGLKEAEDARDAQYEGFLASLKPGEAIRVKDYARTPGQALHWKNSHDGSGRKVMKVLMPEKVQSGWDRKRYEVHWRAVRDPETNKPVEIEPGTVGYIFSNESPFAGRKSTKNILVAIGGHRGWVHVSNIEVYHHEDDND